MPKLARRVALPDLAIDRAAGRPLHLQLYDRLRAAVLDGRLRSGARLPSSRALAAELGLSRTTVLTAYEQLAAEGYLTGRVGAGTRVAPQLPEALISAPAPRSRKAKPAAPRRAVAARGERLAAGRFGPELRLVSGDWRVPFRIAVPALDAFPFPLWTRLVQRHLTRAGQEIVDYQEARGLQRLRAAIAAHLSLSRGARCNADEVLITAGAQSAIDLAVRILIDPGDVAIIEDPSHLGIRGALEGAGAEVAPMPVDADGLMIEAGPSWPAARLAVVTPSNQFPLGVVMSLKRRLALLDWAARKDAWILEDDYDSEFRFSGRPIEALQALDRAGRVIYVGSFSKILFPGLRLGYLVVPPDLAPVFAAARRFVDVHAPVLFQAALADFIEEGHFSQHLRRMRLLYHERAEALGEAVRRELSGALELTEPRAGMHAIAWLTDGLDDRLLSHAAAEEGIEARPLALYAMSAQRPALVLGFGALAPEASAEGAMRLARAVEAARRQR